MSFAQTTILGRIGKEPVYRQYPNGLITLSALVIVNKFWNDKETSLEAKIKLYASIAPKLASFVMAKQTESKISFDEEMSKGIKESSDKLNSLFKQENK